MTETVTVTSASLLTTQEATTGGVIESRLVAQLPLAGRNWDDLIGLVPGVQADRYTEEGGGTAGGRTGGANVHGVRSLQNNFVLDGVDNNSISANVQELTTQIARPSVDSIQEFKVSTNPYYAENGRSPGALVSVPPSRAPTTSTARSTSSIGTVSSTPTTSSTTAPARRSRRTSRTSSAAISAARSSKTRRSSSSTTRARASARARPGWERAAAERDSRRLLDGGGRRQPHPRRRLRDALRPRRRLPPLVPSAFNAKGSFTNNQIPAQCLDPVAQRVLGSCPPPTSSPARARSTSTTSSASRASRTTPTATRGASTGSTSAQNSFFVRYTLSDRFRYVPGIFGGVVDGTGSSANGRLNMKGSRRPIGWTRVISSRLINEFRLGWGRNNSLADCRTRSA